MRSVSFAIADGALPDRYGRGYVVRRLVRRAALDGRRLGINGPVLARLVPVVEKMMAGVYPELRDRRSTIASLVQAEERGFAETLENSPGIRVFEEMTAEIAATASKKVPTERVFEFYDRYGIPLEFMEQRWEDEGVTFDRREFEETMEAYRAKARSAAACVHTWP